MIRFLFVSLFVFSASVACLAESSELPKAISLELLSVGFGVHKNGKDIQTDNGGVSGLAMPEDSGSAYSVSAVFNNGYLPGLKPYLEFASLNAKDRGFSIYSIGLRHDFSLNRSGSWRVYIAGGIGQSYLHWDVQSLSNNISRAGGAKSLAMSLQTGVDWFFKDSWAVGVNLRSDFYQLDTHVIHNTLGQQASTTFSETHALTANLVLSYRFGDKYLAGK